MKVCRWYVQAVSETGEKRSPCYCYVCLGETRRVSDPRLGPSLKGKKVSCEGGLGPRSQLDRRSYRRSGD